MNVKCKLNLSGGKQFAAHLFIYLFAFFTHSFNAFVVPNCGCLTASRRGSTIALPQRVHSRSHSRSMIISIHFIYSFVAARWWWMCSTINNDWERGGEQLQQCHLRFEKCKMKGKWKHNCGVCSTKRQSICLVITHKLKRMKKKTEFSSIRFDSKWKNDERRRQKMWKVKTNRRTCK